MKRIVSMMAVFACLAFVVNSFAANAKKNDKKPAAGKDAGKKDGEKKDDVFYTPDGRPIRVTDNGKVVPELFA